MVDINSLNDEEFRDWYLNKWEEKRPRLTIDTDFDLTEGEKVIEGPFSIFIKKNPGNTVASRYGYMYRAADAILTNKRITLGHVGPLSGKEVFGERNYWFQKDIPKTKSRIGLLGMIMVRDVAIDSLTYGKDMFGEHVKAEFRYSLTKNEVYFYSNLAKKIFSASQG
jgi:hypothetical protein